MIRISESGEIRDLPIPEICQVGRHWSCHGHMTAPKVPQFWFEVRWFDQGWAWRPLNSTDETRGPGANLGNGWRAIRRSATRTPRVSIADDVWVEFCDLTPPAAFAQNVETLAFIHGAALEEVWEGIDDHFYRFGWEEQPEAESELRDGDLVRLEGAMYRVFLPAEGGPTLVARLLLLVFGCTVTIDVQRLTACFESKQVSLEVTGECVRVLAAYANARLDENFVDGGWLAAQESHQRWLDLGGNPNSNVDRLGFERGKLRNQLRRAGVLDVKDLFERQTSGYRTVLRLSLNPDQIFFVE